MTRPRGSRERRPRSGAGRLRGSVAASLSHSLVDHWLGNPSHRACSGAAPPQWRGAPGAQMAGVSIPATRGGSRGGRRRDTPHVRPPAEGQGERRAPWELGARMIVGCAVTARHSAHPSFLPRPASPRPTRKPTVSRNRTAKEPRRRRGSLAADFRSLAPINAFFWYSLCFLFLCFASWSSRRQVGGAPSWS